MNDFTKDELEFIANSISYYSSDGAVNLKEIPILDSVLRKCELQAKHIERQENMKNYFEDINKFLLQQQFLE